MEDYLKRILKVLLYIEDNLDDEITIDELAKIACYSPFHFQKIFSFVVGESVRKYVKRLRMERAMTKLRYGDQNITEIALDASFETPSSFTKAFKKCTGKNPRNYRLFYKEMGMLAKRRENLSDIHPEMIDSISEVEVLFVRRKGSYKRSGKSAWEALMRFIKENKLEIMKLRYFSIAHDHPNITNEENLRFDACLCMGQDINISLKKEKEIATQVLPGGKHAVFCHYGDHDVVTETYDKIFIKWLPDSGEEFDANRFCYIEHYGKELAKLYIPLI